MPSVTVALDDDGLLHLRLPVDDCRVRPRGSAMVGTTTGALAGVAWGDGYTDFDVRLDARLDDPEAPAPALHTWTDAQVEAAVRAWFESGGMNFGKFSPDMRANVLRRMPRALDAALATGPIPAASAPADDEALVEELMPLLINAYSGNPGGYGAVARAALAWMRQRGVGPRT